MGLLEVFKITGRVAVEYSDAQRSIEAVSRSADNAAESIENLSDEAEAAQDSVESLGESTEETQDSVEGMGKSTEKAATAYDSLKEKINNQEKELSELKKQYTNVVLEQGESSDAAKDLASRIEALDSQLGNDKKRLEEAESAAEKLTEEEENLGDETEETGDIIEETEEKTNKFSKVLSTLGTVAGKVGTVMSSVAKGVGLAMTAVGTGVIAAGKAATDVGKTFESSVSQIAATMGKSVEEIDDLKEKAKEMGATTQFSATQAAEGLNILAMSGLSAEEQMVSIDKVLNLAAAGSLSLESAASYATGAVKGFGDSMDNMQYYTDLMAKGATLANTNVEGLGQALSASSATASSYKQEADSVTLSLLRLAEQNITGEAAATSLNRAMADLYTPTDVAKQALDELGISAYDSEGNTRDFNVVVDELNDKLKDMTAEESNAYKAAIFTTNGLNAFNKMTASTTEKVDEFREGLASASPTIESINTKLKESGIEWEKYANTAWMSTGSGIEGLTKQIKYNLEEQGLSAEETAEFISSEYDMAMEDAKAAVESVQDAMKGSAAEQAETMIDNLEGDITLLQSATEGLGNEFYETFNGKLRESVKFATDSVGKLTDAFKDGGLDNLSGVADVAGQIIVEAVNKVVDFAPTLIETVSTLIDSIANALSENSSSIASSAGTLITSIANGLTSNTSTILNAVVNILHNVLSELPNVLSSLISSAGDFTGTIIDFLVSASVEIINALPDLITEILNSLNSTMSTLIPSLISSVSTLVEAVTDNLPIIIKSITDGIPKILKRLLTNLKNNLPQLIDGILNMAEILLANLSSILRTALPELISILTELIPEIITNIVDVVFENLPIILDGLSMLIMAVVDVLPELLESIISMIPTLLTNIINALTNSLPSIVQTVGDLILKLAESLPNFIIAIVDVLPDLINSIVEALATFLPVITETGVTLLTAIIQDLPTIINSIVEKLPEIIDSIIGALLDALPLLIDCGVDLFLALIENLPTIIMEIQECIPQIIEGIAKAAIELFPRIVTVGMQLFMSLVEKLPDVITKLANRMPEIVTGLTNKLKEHIYKMVDIGKNLVEGIWGGIKNAKDWLIDNIFSWCDTVTDSIKDFFGIHSPSTLFRDDIGNNLALGIGEGFADTMSDVSRDMQDSIPTAFDIDPSLNLTSGDSRMQTLRSNPISSGANVQTVQGGSTINFTLQIDNFNNNYGTAVEDMTETMMNKIFDYVRRNKLAVR